MNISRILLASLGAFVVYFVLGGLFFALMPFLRNEFRKYPAVYRTQETMKSVMPAGMAAMFLSMIVLAILFAKIYPAGAGAAEGTQFGALIGLFAIGAFVFHNYVNLNIGLNLTIQSAIAYFIEWVAVGIAIALIYKPAR